MSYKHMVPDVKKEGIKNSFSLSLLLDYEMGKNKLSSLQYVDV